MSWWTADRPGFRDSERERAELARLAESPGRWGELERDLWQAVLSGTSDAATRALARVALAREAGLPRAERERLLLAAVADVWNHPGPVLLEGLLALASSFRAQARLVEALALAHRALAVAESGSDTRARTRARIELASSLLELDAVDRAEPVLERAARESRSLDETEREAIAGLQAECELARGATEPARRWLATSPGRADGTESERAPAFRAVVLASRVHEVEGDLRAAQRVYATAHASPGRSELETALCDFHVARFRLLLRGDTPAIGNAVRLLEEVVADPAVDLGPGRRMYVAIRLAELLARLPGGRGALRRATDLAGAAALERVGEAAEFFRAPPGPLDLPPEIEAAITRRRRELGLRYENLLGAAAGILSDDPTRLPRADSPPSDDALVQACAWCRRVQCPGGEWVPPAEFRPPPGALSLTHGICTRCIQRMNSTMRSD